MRSDRMWSLPISAVAAIIYESIHSGAVKGSVDSDGAVSLAPPGAAARGRAGTAATRPRYELALLCSGV